MLEKINFSYYRNLNNKRKKQFVTRVLIFLRNTHICFATGAKLDMEKKVLIAGSFAQISFGLKFYKMNYFNEIYITEQSYAYKHSSNLFDGDVNLVTRRINMSWPALEKGFAIPDDAINLCMHELGHAIYFDNLKRSVNDKFFSKEELENWKKLALKKMDIIQTGQNKTLRSYAGTNLMEFFSVSLETFFERPTDFQQNVPDLYDCMVHMFNQNPLSAKNPLYLNLK